MTLGKLRLRYIAVSTAVAGVIFVASLIDSREMSTPLGYVKIDTCTYAGICSHSVRALQKRKHKAGSGCVHYLWLLDS